MANRFLLVIPLLLCRLMSPGAAALSFSYNFSNPADLDNADVECMYRQSSPTGGDIESTDRKCIHVASPAGGGIDLTIGTQQNATGRVYHRQRVRLWNGRGQRSSFTTSFSFAIGGDDTNERGDGMAFFVGPSTLPPDSNSMFLGLFSRPQPGSPPPQTVGVEFDTCRNEGVDPPDAADHIGIDVNNIASEYTQALPNKGLYGTMTADISYDGSSKMMRVSLRLENGRTYSVERTVDFRDAQVPRYSNVGFSAATGVLTESHQLLSWSFQSKDPSNTLLWVTLVSIASASLAGLLVALLWVTRCRKKIKLHVAKRFSYHELSAATGNFSDGRVLGQGSFGKVYRGELRDRRDPNNKRLQVAVKRLKETGLDTRRNYVTEITTLGQLSHRNLIRLVGWSDGRGDDKLLLVYELVTNGTLHDHLHHDDRAAKGGGRLLTWPERYRVVLGIADAIDYLHNKNGFRSHVAAGSHQSCILHRDIKPSNVMLDDGFEAKLGDFGLVRHVSPTQASLEGTAMVGSWNYMDPECIRTGSVSAASDVYSFGVLLLEVATGTKPGVVLDQENGFPNTLVNAVRKARAQGEGALLEVADERLNGDFDREQMERVLLVGLLCVQQDRGRRPGIKDAINMLTHSVPQTRLFAIDNLTSSS